MEWIERAFGALLDAHHEVGHAQGLMRDAAQALRATGHEELADRAEREVAPLDAAAGRWTYQVVDEFRPHLLEPARAFDGASATPWPTGSAIASRRARSAGRRAPRPRRPSRCPEAAE